MTKEIWPAVGENTYSTGSTVYEVAQPGILLREESNALYKQRTGLR